MTMFLNLQLLMIFSISYHSEAVIGRGALRLIRDKQYSTTQAWNSGIVQIYYGGWGNICDDSSFGSDEADVVCHQLAYTGASSYGNTGSITIYGTDTNLTAIEDVSCDYSSYLVLLQCSVSSHYSSLCSEDSYDLVVDCYSTRIWDSPSSGQIRLTGGEYSNIGLLEIYCNGEWGTVCDDGFYGTEARVACRQLGYNDYSDYDSGSITGSFSQPIWLDDVSCSSSSYNCLTSCAQCPSSEYHDCDHFEDVNLDCSYSSTYSDVYTTTSDTCENASVSVGVIVGSVIGAIFGLICCILVFTVPFCICCCLGVGVGASSNRSPRTRVVATPTYNQTTSAIITHEDKTTSYPTQDPPPPYTQPAPQPPVYPTPYPTYPTPGYVPDPYPPQQGYPPQPDYPPHPGYPA